MVVRYYLAVSTIGIYRIDDLSKDGCSNSLARNDALRAYCDFISFDQDDYTIECANHIRRMWRITDKEDFELRKLVLDRVKNNKAYHKAKKERAKRAKMHSVL